MTTTIVRLKIIYSLLKKSNINMFILLFTATFVFSCQTNPQKMGALVKDLEEPVVISQDVEWFYTKNGIASHRLTSPKVLRFEGQKEYIEFPLGLEVFSFNAHGEQEAFMKSDYAIQHLDDKTIEAKGGVLLENLKGEKLETESLVWDEKREQIFTEALVKITKQRQLIIGEGFESNTSFSKYTLKNSRGIINLDQVE
jgi:LPS export ABC transporter protein LptC